MLRICFPIKKLYTKLRLITKFVNRVSARTQGMHLLCTRPQQLCHRPSFVHNSSTITQSNISETILILTWAKTFHRSTAACCKLLKHSTFLSAGTWSHPNISSFALQDAHTLLHVSTLIKTATTVSITLIGSSTVPSKLLGALEITRQASCKVGSMHPKRSFSVM